MRCRRGRSRRTGGVSVDSLRMTERRGRGTYEIQLLQLLRRVRQIHDRVVGQVRAVRQDQALEPREAVDAPVLEARVGDGRAAGEVDALEAGVGVHGEMRHRFVGDVFAVAEREAAELRTADDGADGGGVGGGRAFGGGAGVGRVGVGDDPADDAGEEVVGDFAAVAEVDFLEALSGVGHFEDGAGGDVPDGLHFPCLDVRATASDEGVEAFVGDVEAV